MRKFTLLTSVLLTAPFAVGNVSAQCVATQDCATLGYTETSCENGGIKCPFGNTWACKSENNSQGNNNQDCIMGSLYYSDGTCSLKRDKNKTHLGNVVYIDPNGDKWVMSNASVSGVWSTELVDIPEIGTGFTDGEEIYSTSYDGTLESILSNTSCEDTDAMLARGADKYPLAQVVKNYAPQSAPQTKGKWCIPSNAIWFNIYRYGLKFFWFHGFMIVSNSTYASSNEAHESSFFTVSGTNLNASGIFSPLSSVFLQELKNSSVRTHPVMKI